MTDVYHVLEDVAGRPLQRHTVRVSLVAPGNPFVTGGDKPSVIGVGAWDSDADGRVDMLGLIPTSSYEMAGTYYIADCRDNIRRTTEYVYSFQVPATGGPYKLRDLLITPPAPGVPIPPLPAHPLSQHSDVDFTGQAAGYVIARNPGNTGWIAAPLPAGGVQSVTAANGTIVVAGTPTDPTVAVGTVPAGQVSGLAPVATSGSASDITTGTLPTSVLPPLAISDTFTVASQAAMLALAAQRGDVAIRTDTGKAYILAAEPAIVLANWVELVATGQVVSVNGMTGVVVVTAAGIGAVPTARQLAAGTGLTGGGDLTADRTFAVIFGATAGTATEGDDVRLSDARTPTAHAASHAAGGSDPLTLAESQITGLSAGLTSRRRREVFATSQGKVCGEGTGTGSSGQPTGITCRYSFTTSISGRDFRIRVPAWAFAINAALEAALSQTITIKAALYTLSDAQAFPLSFGGSRSVPLEQWGLGESDPLGIYLPKGTLCVLRVAFWTPLTTGTWPQGSVLGGPGVTVTNDGFMNGDVVDGGTFTTLQNNFPLFAPVVTCVPATWPAQSWVAVGDSLTVGEGDTAGVISGVNMWSSSWFTRAVNQSAPAFRIASRGDTAQQYAINHRTRAMQWSDYATHGVVFIGSNDIYNISRTAAQAEADMINGICIPLAKRGVVVTVATLLPRNASSDGWATEGNQSIPDATKEAHRVSFNTWVRDGLPLNSTTLAPVATGTNPALRSGQVGHPVSNWIDTAATVEFGSNTGLWRTNAGVLTADGAHPNATGHGLVAAALTVTAAT